MTQTKVDWKEWLVEQLQRHNGAAPVSALLGEAATTQGFNAVDLYEAALALGVKSEQDGGKWYWRLPFGYDLTQVFESNSDWYVDRDFVPTPRVVRKFRETGEIITYFRTGNGWRAPLVTDTEGEPIMHYSTPVPELDAKLNDLLAQAERAK